MNNTNNETIEMLKATKVSQQLDICTKTLDMWYKFYFDKSIPKPDDMPELPMYHQDHPRGPRYWKVTDIPKLQAFKEWIPRGRNGVMSEISTKYWSHSYREERKEKDRLRAEAKKLKKLKEAQKAEEDAKKRKYNTIKSFTGGKV